MKCVDCCELISAYLDQELEPHIQAKVQEHLKICPECQTVQASLTEVRTLLYDCIDAAPVPEGLCTKVMTAVARDQAKVRRQIQLTAFVLLLLTSPVFVLFTPLITRLLHLGYVTLSVVWRSWPPLLKSISPQTGWTLGISALLLTAAASLIAWSLLRGLRVKEVFS